ncbi:hypothetical protein C5C67_10285 [Rathayibacter sp. AY1E1]|nr:hypothetical protein C5C67_10285 [Rathayibacter sp. AY1E1]
MKSASRSSAAANDCVWDGGALTAAPISLDQLSTDVDYFHPNVAGQAMIAEELWTAWGLGDEPAPTPTPTPTSAPTAAPAPAPTGSPAPSRDTTAPKTVITAPTSGSTVRGSVTLVATAKDDVGTTKLSFWSGATRLGDATRASDGTWRLTVSASSYPAGRYAIVAHASDAAGNRGRSASITLKR